MEWSNLLAVVIGGVLSMGGAFAATVWQQRRAEERRAKDDEVAAIRACQEHLAQLQKAQTVVRARRESGLYSTTGAEARVELIERVAFVMPIVERLRDDALRTVIYEVLNETRSGREDETCKPGRTITDLQRLLGERLRALQ